MSSKRLNRTDVGIKRMVLSRIGTNLNHARATVILNKAIAWIAEIVLGLPKVIMTRLKMTVVTALAIALVVMSFPIEASAVGAAPLDVSGIGALNSGNVTFQGELELGAVFTSLIPGPGGNWHFSLSGDCVWKVNPAVTIAGRGYVVGSLPLLNSDTGHIRLSLDRLFLQHELGRVRAIIGKQAINWGVASVFRPTDLITPRGSDMSGKGRPGKVLGSLFFRTSPLTGVEVVLGENLYAGRAEFRIGQTNLGIIGLIERRNLSGNSDVSGSMNGNVSGRADSANTVGVDFQGGLKGLYGEICHTWQDTAAQSSSTTYPGMPSATSATSGTIGWKTVLPGGNLVFAEYCRNHVNLGHTGIVTQLAAAGITHQYDEFTTFNLVGLADLTDGNWTATGTLTSVLADNLDLNCGLSVTKGPLAQAQVMLKWYL